MLAFSEDSAVLGSNLQFVAGLLPLVFQLKHLPLQALAVGLRRNWSSYRFLPDMPP